MTQFNLPTINPATHTGTNLADWLNQWKPAVLSSHSGVAAPAYAVQGMPWLDTSNAATPNFNAVLKIYNGSAWVTIGTAKTNSATWTPANALPLTGGTLTGPLTTGGNITVNNPAAWPAVTGGTALAGGANDVFGISRSPGGGGGQFHMFGPSHTTPNGAAVYTGAAGSLKSFVFASSGNLTVPGDISAPSLRGGTNGGGILRGVGDNVNIGFSFTNEGGFWHWIDGSALGIMPRSDKIYILNWNGTTMVGGITPASSAVYPIFTPSGFSDAALKTGVAPTQVDALAALAALEVIEWAWTKDGLRMNGLTEADAFNPIGFTYQNVEAVMPEAATRAELPEGAPQPDVGVVIKDRIVPYLVRANQQMQAIVADLKNRIAALEGSP